MKNVEIGISNAAYGPLWFTGFRKCRNRKHIDTDVILRWILQELETHECAIVCVWLHHGQTQ